MSAYLNTICVLEEDACINGFINLWQQIIARLEIEKDQEEFWLM
jgi:hypothetical protein